MVRSGEASGQMSAVLDRLVEHLQRQRALRDSIVSATIYPAILLAVAVLSLVAMLISACVFIAGRRSAAEM